MSPENSSVHKMFVALKREGKSVASAAKISQARTGLALMTGKKPKHSKAKALSLALAKRKKKA